MTGDPAAGAAAPALTFRDLVLGYGRRPAVHHLDGTVRRGDLLAVVGPNGAGKSTLLKGIVGEAAILHGSIDRHGSSIRDLAYLPQSAEIDRDFPIRVADLVSLGLWRETGPFRPVGADGRRRVAAALERVGLGTLGRRGLSELSGGQLQRVLFARTIVQDAPLILLDEPFAGVDEGTTDVLLDVLAEWHREGRTVLAALHDLDRVRTTFPTTLLLARDPVAWGPTAAVLAPANLAAARSRTEAWREDAAVCARPHPAPAPP